MFKLILNIRQSFLTLYTFLGLAYIIFIALPCKTAVFYYYSVAIVGQFVFNILIPCLKATYTTLDFNKSYLGTVLKI